MVPLWSPSGLLLVRFYVLVPFWSPCDPSAPLPVPFLIPLHHPLLVLSVLLELLHNKAEAMQLAAARALMRLTASELNRLNVLQLGGLKLLANLLPAGNPTEVSTTTTTYPRPSSAAAPRPYP